MDDFVIKLNNGEFKKDAYPQVGKDFNGDEEEISRELETYKRLLDSRIIDEAIQEEQGLVKKTSSN